MYKIRIKFLFVFFVLFAAVCGYSQTFRGAVSGSVIDQQGALIAGAAVQLLSPSTGTVQNGVSNSAGEFNFPELQPGIYAVTVTLKGFKVEKIDAIDVAVSKVVNLKIELSIGSESTVVDVQANGVQVDTTSSALVSVVDAKSVQDMPMNGRDFTKMIRFNAGVVGSGYSNGNSHINYQVDGTDNVDSWLGIVASNQGGIASVPGGLVPVEAIDQFSIQSQGEADMGRNAGSNQNMVLKSGTNQIHGDVYYYFRNEYFAAITPVSPVGSRKAPIRNNQFGFSLGGPLWKNHTFLFLTGEVQLASAGNSLVATAINPAWINVGKQFNALYSGLPPAQNAVTASVYSPSGIAAGTNIFPDVTPGTGAVVNNWLATAPSQYNSYNGVIKLDHHFSEKVSISLRYLGTTGKQTAVTGSDYAQFFQTAPMHIHNASVIQTWVISPKLLNQVTMGMNYFLQTFNDANQNYYPAKNNGINVGATGIIAAGAPTIAISGFQSVGATQPSGRTDVTGQITDSLRWTVGKHSIKIGGEYRHTNVYSISLGSSRGSFSFDGTGGPWSSAATSTSVPPQITPFCIATDNTLAPASNPKGYTATQYAQCAAINAYSIGGAAFVTGNITSGTAAQARGQKPLSNVISVADFFLGQTSATLTSAKLRVGDGTRIYLLNQEDFWLSDSYQITQKLSLNYGLRYSIPGAVYDAKNDLYSWTPQGFKPPIYNNYYGGVAPRVGFAYNVFPNGRTVLRGAWGLIYDVPSMSSMAGGTSSNPSGPDPSYVGTTPSFRFAYGANPFTTPAPPTLTGVGVNQNYRIAYQMNYNLGIEQQLSRNSLLTIGYTGAQGRRLPVTYDFNQATSYTAAGSVFHRPYDTASTGVAGIAFPGQTVVSTAPFAALTQLTSGGISNFNSFNVSFRQSMWKGVTATANYIWGKMMDNSSSPVTNYPSNNPLCTNCVGGVFPNGRSGSGLSMEYGPGSGDTRHTFDGFLTYNLPKFNWEPRISSGWQVNALYSFYTGGVLNPLIGSDYSFTTEGSQRPNLIPGKQFYIPKTTTVTATGARVYTTVSAAPFDYPIAGVTNGQFGAYGNLRRNQFNGTAFGDVDFSLFKYTPITEKIKTEFRAEVFNILNQSNLANPSVSSFTSTTFGQITNTKNGSGAPGLGYGEPFNVQFALKILF